MAAVTTGLPHHIQEALKSYTAVAEDVVGESLAALNPDRMTQLNNDHDYPYRFSYFHHEAIPGEFVLVDVKEPWYHDYLRAMEDAAALPTKEEQVQREQQLYDDLKTRLERAHKSSSDSH